MKGLHLAVDELDGVDEQSARVFRAFLATLRLHRRLMMTTLATHGTHPGQAVCLRVLAGDDGITQRDLAAALHIARPTASKMLAAMERAGLIARRPDEADQRLTRVYLTASGRDLEAELRGVAHAYIDETIGALPENDRRELARLLEDLGASISRAIAVHGGDAGAAGDGGTTAGRPAAGEPAP
jgi:MarR family transcriptional regulator, organic hydroperoxide resistance regulator